MKIRNAVVSDSQAIGALLKALGYPPEELPIAEKIAQQLSHPDASLVVAVQEEVVWGFVSLHFIPQLALQGDFCRISYFCVAEEARSLGIGAMLEAEIHTRALQ